MVVLTWFGILFCLSQSAVLSGLNLALFAIGKLELFSRHALHVVAVLSPILRTYQVLLYPIAAPTAWLLNAWLGGEEIVFFRERDLRRVIQLHILLWNDRPRVVTGRDILGRLLRGIAIPSIDVPQGSRSRPERSA